MPGGRRISAAESIGRAGQADATRDLFERYARQVFGFCLSRLGSREEAEDAVQSTFLNAHRALQRGVTPESELAWLLKIAHNVCLTRRRSSRRRHRVEAAHDIDAMQDYLPAPAHESADELLRLEDALAHLPESQRRAILLREWQGLSYAEIARDLHVTQSAVETLIFRARRSLATNLQTVFERPRVLARARNAIQLGWLVPSLRSLLEGGVAAKAAATTAAVAVSSAAVLATPSSGPRQRASVDRDSARAAATAPAAEAPSAVRPRLAERGLAVSPPATPANEQSTRNRRTPGSGSTNAPERSAGKAQKEKKEKRTLAKQRPDHVKKAKPQQRVKPTTAKPARPVRPVQRPQRATNPKKQSKPAAAPVTKRRPAKQPADKSK